MELFFFFLFLTGSTAGGDGGGMGDEGMFGGGLFEKGMLCGGSLDEGVTGGGRVASRGRVTGGRSVCIIRAGGQVAQFPRISSLLAKTSFMF